MKPPPLPDIQIPLIRDIKVNNMKKPKIKTGIINKCVMDIMKFYLPKIC